MNSRQLALKCLVKVYKEGAYSNIVIDKQLSAGDMDARDRAFASALFYGVLERKITLDYNLQPYCSQKLKKLTPPVLAALELGLYQLLYMPHLPQSAVVNEAVEVVKKAGQPRAGGLVNGVLRSVIRGGCKINLPDTPAENRLSVMYSVTPETVKMLLESYGAEKTEKFLEASSGKPPIYIRVNSLKTTAEELTSSLERQGVVVKAHPAAPNCLEIDGAGDVRNLKSFNEGLFHVQDASSQLCAFCLDAKPGMEVADMCAAPGGKSFTIAQYMENEGNIYAFDLYESRVRLIKNGADRLGCSCIQAQQGDASSPVGKPKDLDRILCDVPCSGLGIIRRKPEIRLKKPEDNRELTQIQYDILSSAAGLLKKGGLIIYSTCSVDPVENMGVVERFLKASPDYELGSLPLAGGKGHITLMGESFDSDGFFIAAIRRKA